jgi:predicted acetyltransferase
MKYYIKPAEIKDKVTIKDLLQPYLEELSRFPDDHPDIKDENGIYLYPYLDAYWEEVTRFPYLFYAGKKLAGFAMVRKAEDHWEIAEFYVKPGFRRQGLGEWAATQIFKKHRGKWRIGFNKHNNASRALWKKLAKRLSKSAITKGETDTSHDYIRFSV